MTRNNTQQKREAFKELMKLIPEETVKAQELNRLLAEYQESLREEAEAQLVLRGEPVAAEVVEVEMSLINAEQAKEMAKDYAEGKGEFEGTH